MLSELTNIIYKIHSQMNIFAVNISIITTFLLHSVNLFHSISVPATVV